MKSGIENKCGAPINRVQRFLVVWALLVASFCGTPRAIAEEESQEIQAAKKLLESQEKLLGSGHPGLVTNLNHLAILYLRAEKFEKAEETYRRALISTEKAF